MNAFRNDIFAPPNLNQRGEQSVFYHKFQKAGTP
jgi:hypothetical protein